MPREVLVVEDEPDIRRLVVLHLEREGFRCRTATSGADALAEVKAAVPDLVVLDLMLTAKSDEVDRIVGLEMGADDYVAKPFSPKELVARVRAVLRRAHPAPATPVLSVGPITLDAARHLASVHDRPIVLTPKEFDLLQALLESAGRVLSREYLLNRVWATRARMRSSRAPSTCTSGACGRSSATR